MITPFPIRAPNRRRRKRLHPYSICGDQRNNVAWTSHHNWTNQAGLPRKFCGSTNLSSRCTPRTNSFSSTTSLISSSFILFWPCLFGVPLYGALVRVNVGADHGGKPELL